MQSIQFAVFPRRGRRDAARVAAPPRLLAVAAALALCCAAPAQAHITLENGAAPVGSFYKAVFRVPHGCDGSDTTAIKIQIPEGVAAVKPQPKSGWTIQTKDGAYAEPIKMHGATLDHGVRELSWSGGDLPDAYFDEFALMAYLSPALKPGGALHFPVVQECKSGTARWIDTQDAHAPNPAPALKLLPARKSE